MRSGKLDTSITIQVSTRTTGPGGVSTVVWSDFAKVRAEIMQSGTEQFFRAYGAVDEAVTLFRIRYLDGLKTTHRIMLDDVEYRITEITEIRRRRGFEIRAVSP